MAYALSESNIDDSSSSLPPTPWVVSSADNIMAPPVFFQRIRPIMDPLHETSVCFPIPHPVLVSELDDIYDTFKTVPYEVDSGTTTTTTTTEFSTFSTIGIIQHAYLMNGSDTYTFLETLGPRPSTLKNVATDDPSLQTWEPFIDVMGALITRHQTETLDLMACALYSDPNWKYVIDELEARLTVNIRASLDNTGAASMGGNWILESDSANLKGVYFTDAIDGWNHILDTTGNERNYVLVLVDSRVPYIDSLLSNLPIKCCSIVFSYYNDTPETIYRKIRKLNSSKLIIRENEVILEDDSEGSGYDLFHFISITIIPDSSIGSCNTYKFLDVMSECTLINVENDDSGIASWGQFIEMFYGLITTYSVLSIDIRCPEINNNLNWKYAIKELMTRLGVYVRAIDLLEFMPQYSF